MEWMYSYFIIQLWSNSSTGQIFIFIIKFHYKFNIHNEIYPMISRRIKVIKKRLGILNYSILVLNTYEFLYSSLLPI